jgi:hypothetical protein
VRKDSILSGGFYFRLCRCLIFLFAFFCGCRFTTLLADQTVYDDALENGWQDWGWATRNYANTSPAHSGSDSISVTISSAWQGLQIYHADMDDTAYTNISFWLNGGGNGGQILQVYGLLHLGTTNNFAQSARYSIGPLVANSWQQFNVPLSTLGVAGQNNFTGFVIQDAIGATQPTFYVDDITLQSGQLTSSTNANVTVQIDAAVNRHAISPLIYGVAFAANSNELRGLNVPLHRSGGNSTTRYNWQSNVSSLAADWYFECLPNSPNTPGGDADDFIQESKDGGAQAMLTIPIIGWVGKLGPGRTKLSSFSIAKYGSQTGSDPWWPDAGNGVSTNGLNITTNDPTDANMVADTNFQAGWVRHLTNQWGAASQGGLRYYLMDNEWSIWQGTHRDVHPVGATMDEVLGKFCDYATMVKGIDTNALVAGPEEWGWPGYFYSGYDQQWSGAHSDYNPAHYPDRAAHGGQDFGPWFLNQVKLRSQAAGRRLLDVFTLHCYPAESNVPLSGDVSASVMLARNRSTRALWDTNYVDESWVNSVIALIPRMKNWVATNYPGTLTGITEYNWGADDYMNGATAQADVLGIFGREGLDLATRWTCPGTNTPAYNAFKMYRNYDGNKSAFGDTSILATVPNPDALATFAAVRTSDGALTVMVINKDPNNATPVTLNFTNFAAAGTAQVWQLATNNISQLNNPTFTNGILTRTLPAQSLTLFVLPPLPPFHLRPGASSSAGQLTLWLEGQAGQSYSLQSSTDLLHWFTISTNALLSNSFAYSITITGSAIKFYRGRWAP